MDNFAYVEFCVSADIFYLQQHLGTEKTNAQSSCGESRLILKGYCNANLENVIVIFQFHFENVRSFGNDESFPGIRGQVCCVHPSFLAQVVLSHVLMFFTAAIG